MSEIVTKIRAELESLSCKNQQLSGQKFFKEGVKLYGIRTAMVTSIGKVHYKAIRHQLGIV